MAERASLENWSRGNSTVGSNPTPSATPSLLGGRTAWTAGRSAAILLDLIYPL